ncbi:hypothetical protein [Novosphingobium sp. BL-52-GroH]|uniref:hypothetical protein n=1 Tax=Novosphingobium sp. BL-52-GroH TaxID=3349877 RepID=UPI00384D68BC
MTGSIIERAARPSRSQRADMMTGIPECLSLLLGGTDVKSIHDNVEGPFAIEEDIALYGTITGAATLRSGFRLILHGTIAGSLTVERESPAIIHGTDAGRIFNYGGRMDVSAWRMASPIARWMRLRTSTQAPM